MAGYKIETLNLAKGKTMKVVRLTLIAGRRAFASDGFIQSSNPNFMNRNGEYVHYNRIMKCWIYEAY